MASYTNIGRTYESSRSPKEVSLQMRINAKKMMNLHNVFWDYSSEYTSEKECHCTVKWIPSVPPYGLTLMLFFVLTEADGKTTVKVTCSDNLGPKLVPLAEAAISGLLAGTGCRMTAKESDATASSGGCYVATAVYGSYNCPQVWTLRRYRDYSLAETWHGRAFIKMYYAISPTIVRWFGDTEWFKKMWRGKLDQIVEKCRAKGYSDTPYEDRIW